MSHDHCLLALDLGTTTLAGRLLGLDGRVLAEGRLLNPQVAMGGDIMRRLELALAGEDVRLQALLCDGLRELVGVLLHQAGLYLSDIKAAAAAGNPGMVYLLRRLPVKSILFPPHRPTWRDAVYLTAEEVDLGLGTPLYLFPLVSGYVGGDLVAFLFSRGEIPENSFFLDAGTNGEMALYAKGRWRVTSVAAGPAFEGGDISCGMVAAVGAISNVSLVEDALRLTVIGGGRPRGICGSGLAAALAAALEGGLVDTHGTVCFVFECSSGWAGLNTGATGHAIGGHEIFRPDRNAAVKAAPFDGQGKCPLNLFAGPHTAVADDTFGGVIGEIRVAVVLWQPFEIGRA